MRIHRPVLALAILLAVPAAPSGVRSAEADWESQLDASIREFKNRRIYTKLTPEIIATIPDDKLEQAILDFIDHKMAADRSREPEILRGLPEGFRAIYCPWLVEAEVHNGGFNQYFWNSSGRYAADAVAGFKFLGARELADLMERAIAIEREDRQRTQKLKDRATIDAFSESYEENRLNTLDERFYELSEDLGTRRIKFIRAHPAHFAAE